MRYLNIDTSKKISKIGLGTWQFGSRQWGYGERYNEHEAYAIVNRALELGVTLFDTAEIYGRSEHILGRAIGKNREAAFLATKLWPVMPSSSLVRQRARSSARRLGVSRIDLYQSHFPNPLVSDNSIMRGMRSLQRTGLVGEVGVSGYSLDRWRAAEDALRSRVLSNQVCYNLVTRSPELSLLPFAESHGRIIIAFSPLARGLLSGKYDEVSRPVDKVRANSGFFQPENLQHTPGLIATLREVADAHGATPAQIALAWVIRSPAVVAIPGASSVKQVESNVAAAEIELASDEYEALNTASAWFRPTTVADARLAGKIHRDIADIRHSVKGGLLLAQSVWDDHAANRGRHA